ncbi:MAG: PQQ-binding-like beta-propeller repeat protein, partial [Armatimonadota bacterium]
MKWAAIAKVIPGIVIALCAFLLVFWFSSNRRAVRVAERVPGQDQREGSPEQPSESDSSVAAPPIPSATPGGNAPVAQTAQPYAPPPVVPGEWPRFRGEGFSNISSERVALATKWAVGAPPILWSLDVGEGHAGAAVSNSRAYVLDYDRQAQADVLRCLALADGRELWRYSYPVSLKRNHGMSRTVPAVSGDYVVTIGPKCNVLCANAQTGKPYWMIDLVKDYRSEIPPWYAGQCPLIDAGRAIIAPGGTSLMIAVDCATGKV